TGPPACAGAPSSSAKGSASCACATGCWNRDHMLKVYRGRDVVGEYQPGRKVNGREVPDGPPVPGYYPAVLTEEEWQAVQAAISGRRRTGGRPPVRAFNLFTGLAFDAATGRPLGLKGLSSGPP